MCSLKAASLITSNYCILVCPPKFRIVKHEAKFLMTCEVVVKADDAIFLFIFVLVYISTYSVTTFFYPLNVYTLVFLGATRFLYEKKA